MLVLAAGCDSLAVVRGLVERGFDPTRPALGTTAVHAACARGSLAVVKWLGEREGGSAGYTYTYVCI